MEITGKGGLGSDRKPEIDITFCIDSNKIIELLGDSVYLLSPVREKVIEYDKEIANLQSENAKKASSIHCLEENLVQSASQIRYLRRTIDRLKKDNSDLMREILRLRGEQTYPI